MKKSASIKDLTGQRFGRLTVIGIKPTETRKTYWICQCDCGNLKTVRSDSLQCGAVRSCGCLKKEQNDINLNQSDAKKKFIASGHKVGGTRLYQIWQGMRARCYNQHNSSYHRYGGRGITICEEWRTDFYSFYNWSMSNGYTDDLTIDRKDTNGNYEPDNCRWTTQKEQANNRNSNIDITIGNSTRSLLEWCEIFDLDYSTINARYNRNDNLTIDELFNGRG